jgi:hypothetical protein
MKKRKYIVDVPQPYAWLIAMGYKKLPFDPKSPPEIGEKVYIRGRGFIPENDTRIIIREMRCRDGDYKLDLAAAITGKIIGSCVVTQLLFDPPFYGSGSGYVYQGKGAAVVTDCRVINPRYTPGAPGLIRQLYPPKCTDNSWIMEVRF